MLEASCFTTLPVSCPITKFTFEDTTALNKGLSIDSACVTPDTSDACRTIVVPTHRARYTNHPDINYGHFTYKFTIEAEGPTTYDYTGIIKVRCTDATVISYSGNVSPLAYTSLTRKNAFVETEIIVDATKFTVDDVGCPIISFSIDEVTTTAPGYAQSQLPSYYSGQCLTPDLSDACRTLKIPRN
jgi:hypothetical protein